MATDYYDRDSDSGLVRFRKHVTLADIVAMGAAATGTVSLLTLPVGAYVEQVRVQNSGAAEDTLTALEVGIGVTGNVEGLKAAADVKAANAVSQVAPVDAFYAASATKALIATFDSTSEDLDTATGLEGGVDIYLVYREKQ